MTTYGAWVLEYPLLSAAVHFAILGTIGEILSVSIVRRRMSWPGNAWQVLGKVAAWALLGIVIKYGFAGMKGFTRALVDQQLLPSFLGAGIGWALAVSTLTNVFFGPQMMLFHRLEDNLILREWSFAGLTTAWWTLLWFWIPAHTVTFSLPLAYQIPLAAVWSVVLGAIMGFTKARKAAGPVGGQPS
jgi:small-conductance mechanosensitive channel